MGEAHTHDGIVVWIPEDKVLFGGNGIRNYNGWVGNISDANIYEWSRTATDVKNEYENVRIVVPGHGKCGGVELIDYTIKLFKITKQNIPGDNSDISLDTNLKTDEEFYFTSDSILLQEGKQLLKNAVMVAQDVNKYVIIEAPEIVYQQDKKRIDPETGRIKIYNKTTTSGNLRTDVNYRRLIIYKYDEIVGLVVILKEIMKDKQ